MLNLIMVQSETLNFNILNGGVRLPSKADCTNSAIGGVLFGGDMIEIWKQIKEYPSYYISNFGRIISYRRKYKRHMNPALADRRYPFVDLWNDFGHKQFFMHLLVLTAFKQARPTGFVCNHIDGNKKNNHIDNLEWVLPEENIAHALSVGLIKTGKNSPLFGKKMSKEFVIKMRQNNKGSGNPNAILKETEVFIIKKLLTKNIKVKIIAQLFNVKRSLIDSIKAGRTWKSG